MSRRRNHGFTLLEVLVALTITGIAVAALFGLLGGSKRLSFSSSETLAAALFQRAAANAWQIEEKSDFPAAPEPPRWRVEVRSLGEIEPPERQTKPISYALERYLIVDGQGNEVVTTTRWKRLEVPR